MTRLGARLHWKRFTPMFTRLGRLAQLGLVSMSFTALIGCVQRMVADPAPQAGSPGEGEKAVIVGGLSWQETTSLPEGSAERHNAQAVALLQLPAQRSRCTGFLIAPDVLMTNHHCVPEAAAAAGARARFHDEEGGLDEDTGFDCSTFIGSDAGLDYALVQCAGRPGDTQGVVGLEATSPAENAGIYVIHQNCDFSADPSCAPTKKYSPGRVLEIAREIGHDADTLGGSSGAPLFARATHGVVGLHHQGVGNRGDGRGTLNRAVPMTDILPVIARRYPGLALGARAPAEDGAADPGEPGPVDAVDAGGADGADADGYEPNDTLPGAVQVALPFASVDARVGASPGDVDHFSFVADGPSRAISLAFRHAEGDLDLFVLDTAGRELARSIGTTDSEEVIAAFPAGQVIVRVVGYNGARGSYTLDIR